MTRKLRRFGRCHNGEGGWWKIGIQLNRRQRSKPRLDRTFVLFVAFCSIQFSGHLSRVTYLSRRSLAPRRITAFSPAAVFRRAFVLECLPLSQFDVGRSKSAAEFSGSRNLSIRCLFSEFDVGRWTLSVRRLLEFRLSTLNIQPSPSPSSSCRFHHRPPSSLRPLGARSSH